MFSDIPAAMGPFLFTLMLNPGSTGGSMWTLWGIGALLIILIVAEEVFPTS